MRVVAVTIDRKEECRRLADIATDDGSKASYQALAKAYDTRWLRNDQGFARAEGIVRGRPGRSRYGLHDLVSVA